MKKHRTLLESPRYRIFVQDRDRELERVLRKYLEAASRVLAVVKTDTLRIASHIYAHPHDLSTMLMVFDRRVNDVFSPARADLLHLMQRLRVTTFTLTHRSEAEAMARALGRDQKVMVSKDKLAGVIGKDGPRGGSLSGRLDLMLSRMKRELLNSFQMSLVMEEREPEMLSRLRATFPKLKTIKKPKRVLKALEATKIEKPKATFMGVGFIDDDAWEQVKDDYLTDELPFPTYRRTPYDWEEVDGECVYDWEVEKEITQDFVARVRDGSIDAANENGVTDFAWIAVLDKDTCDDCCAPRSGLSSAEIEAALDSGDLDDDCDAVTPPAHFNCRCVPAPITEDMPAIEPAYVGSFDEWMSEVAS